MGPLHVTRMPLVLFAPPVRLLTALFAALLARVTLWQMLGLLLSHVGFEHKEVRSSEYWLWLNMGHYSTWPWIQTCIPSCGAISQDLHRTLIFSLPIGGKICDNCFCFYWGMQLSTCRPSGLPTQENSAWFKPPRYLLTFLAVCRSINCFLDKYLWFTLNHFTMVDNTLARNVPKLDHDWKWI